MVSTEQRQNFETLVAAAYIDRKLAPEEAGVLQKKATEFDIPQELLAKILQRGAKGELSLALPPSVEQRLELLDHMIDVIIADGKIDPAENRILQRLAIHMQIDPVALNVRVHAGLQKIVRAKRPPRTARPPEPSPTVQPSPPPKAIERVSAPPPRLPEPQPPPSASTSPLTALPRGPIQLGNPLAFNEDLPPVTQGLVRSVLLFDGVEGAVHYLLNSCHIPDEGKARAIIERMLKADPTIVPRSKALETHRRQSEPTGLV